MAVINVDDIYILGETGEQVDKVTGLFTKDEDTTSGEKAFAQLNIGTAGSNRNLLDNPWFTVNQRQITTPSSPISGYPSDRWYGTYSAVTSDGVTIPAQNSLDLFQRLEPSLCAALVGKTVTVSTLEQDGTIASFTCVFPAYGSGEGSNYNMGNGIGCFVQNVSGYQRVRFRVSDARTTPFALRAAKLELGSVSTLANDAPPEYAEELMKCNFYDIMLKTSAQYGYLGYGIADSATSATILIPLPNNMRDATPTITTGGTIAVKGGTSGTHTITGITFKLRVTGGVLVTVATAGLTTGEFCLLQLNNTSSYINISADI